MSRQVAPFPTHEGSWQAGWLARPLADGSTVIYGCGGVERYSRHLNGIYRASCPILLAVVICIVSAEEKLHIRTLVVGNPRLRTEYIRTYLASTRQEIWFVAG